MSEEREPFNEQLAFVMREVFAGCNDGATFLDDGTPALFALLDGLSAAEASRPVAGYCLAAHARHVAFSLKAYVRAVDRADMAQIADNWPDWAHFSLAEEEWTELRQDLRNSFGSFQDWLRSRELFSDFGMRLLLGALAHMSFHLGAAQVKYDELKRNPAAGA